MKVIVSFSKKLLPLGLAKALAVTDARTEKKKHRSGLI